MCINDKKEGHKGAPLKDIYVNNQIDGEHNKPFDFPTKRQLWAIEHGYPICFGEWDDDHSGCQKCEDGIDCRKVQTETETGVPADVPDECSFYGNCQWSIECSGCPHFPCSEEES